MRFAVFLIQDKRFSPVDGLLFVAPEIVFEPNDVVFA